MTRLPALLLSLSLLGLPLSSLATDYTSSLLVQTGEMREGDLIVRNITDLNSKQTCLAFYISTGGTSSVIKCYPAVSGFGARLSQVGHIKTNELVIRKLEDSKNNVACLVAYISTPGTSPAVDCYSTGQPAAPPAKGRMIEEGHLREGDLDVRRIVDGAAMKTCIVAYVVTKGTSPAVLCYDSPIGTKGGLYQSEHLQQEDLIVRKVHDVVAKKACLVTYVSTEGTSSHLYCYDES
ncbi:hypothetical protein [Candidatus Venteria ishoeyi]|uniref:Uncharacterized protein n=1 Tax=Candidatus Venteria ishoeyi TaxID=1899563 RepID=A0A1H6F3F2_9GAMM|nr:hypothetical protein [Candidatus Venteria ishoeyi]MDM8545436.1 hypothetical protein [Candidatus Venteria ishoeyi]SEH04650.1 Uncharacterised protein [Candidatus Venteria ishoeyi]